MTLLPERRRFRTTAGELAYLDLGEGRPVLLLHGFPTSSHLWRREAWLLAQRMRVIAPDLLGYGESDQPAGADLSTPAQTGYVRELLAALEVDELAVVGHGAGGAIAQLLALDGQPQVRAMVLVDAACFEGWPPRAVRRIQATPPEEQTLARAEEVARAFLTEGVGHADRLEDADVEAYVRPWRADAGALFRAAAAQADDGLGGRQRELAARDLPTLVVWGEDDPYVPSELGERLGEMLQGSTVALLPGCSHFVNEDAPQVVGPLIHEYLRVRYLDEGHRHSSEPVAVFLERPPAGWR